jgi:hypothetical protein
MDRAEQAREYRRLYRCVAALLDEALAEAESVADAEGGLDFPLGKFGKLLIHLGAGAHALRQHLAERRAGRRGGKGPQAGPPDGRRADNGRRR